MADLDPDRMAHADCCHLPLFDQPVDGRGRDLQERRGLPDGQELTLAPTLDHGPWLGRSHGPWPGEPSGDPCGIRAGGVF